MAWNQAKPANSDYLVSADVRANFAAVADQALGRNLLGDPDFLIWAIGTCGHAPSWWNIAGQTSAGNIRMVQSTTALTLPAGTNRAPKLTYAATLTLFQNVLSTGDMTTSIKRTLGRQSVSAGAMIYTTSNNCKLLLHGPSSEWLSSSVPASAWTWMTRTGILTTSTVTRLGMGVKLAAAGVAYLCQPTLVIGPIPPDQFIPAAVARGTLGTQLSGNPIAVTTDFDGAWNYSHQLPFIVERVDVRALTAATTANMIIDVQHQIGTGAATTSWKTIFSATSATSRPQLSKSCSIKVDSATPDGAYRLRCFAADVNGVSSSNSTVNIKLTQACGAGGKNPIVKIRALTYQPPLQSWRAVGNYK